MALTRSMLKGMGLTDEQVGAIIEEHTSVTSALKDQIREVKDQFDEYKEKADKLSTVEKELEELKKDVSDNDWKGKYDREHEDFEKYKNEVQSKEAETKVKNAYKKLLVECKVGEKHIDSIIRVTDFKDIKLNSDGSLDNADKLKERINADWDGFIMSEDIKGADIDKPPASNGGSTDGSSRAAELAAKYHDNLYGKGKEN